MDIYRLLYGEFFFCTSCDFEFNKLGQKGYVIEGGCPSCGEDSIEYLPVKNIEVSVKRMIEELEAI